MTMNTPLTEEPSQVVTENTVWICNELFERVKHEDPNGIPCKICGTQCGDIHHSDCKDEECPACGESLIDCLSGLRMRAPFEKVIEEFGCEPEGEYNCHAGLFMYPNTDIFLEPTGVRLYRRMHVPVEDESNKKILEFLNLYNDRARVARFYVNDEFPGGYIRASAEYVGKYDHAAFKSFLELWFADIDPIPDSISEGIKAEKMRLKKSSDEICHRSTTK